MVSQAQNFIIIGDAVIIELMARLYKGSGTKKLSVGKHSFSANFRRPFSAGFCKPFSGTPYVNVSWSSTSCGGRQQCALNNKREVIVEKDQTVNHGAKIIAGQGVIQGKGAQQGKGYNEARKERGKAGKGTWRGKA